MLGSQQIRVSIHVRARPGQNNVSIRTNISHNPMERNLGTVPNREGVTGGWMVGMKCGLLLFFKGIASEMGISMFPQDFIGNLV